MNTIVVDPGRCTRCGICSAVCTARIIVPPKGKDLPAVPEGRADRCIRCGHCETHCPTEALALQFLPEEKVPRPAADRTVAPDALGDHLRRRRSVRHFSPQPVSRERFARILDVARYAASAGNGQPVQWTVILDPAEVHRLAGLTIEWMRTLAGTDHPMGGYVPSLVADWDRGGDPICRGAPHLVVAHVPEGNPINQIDAIIALTHVDIAAPAFGVGTCWAGFLSMAARDYGPLQAALAIPEGRRYAYALFCGTPRYASPGIPRRDPLVVEWR